MPGIYRTVALIAPGIRQVLRNLVEGESPWPLVLTGSAGAGKTCAALCLLDYAGGTYYTVWSLCDTLIRSQQGRLDWNEAGRGGTIWPDIFWKRLNQQPLTVLDELGCRDKASDHHYECVKNLVDARHGKPLVVISNHTLSDIATLYDDRIASRLAAGTLVDFAGKDKRLES